MSMFPGRRRPSKSSLIAEFDEEVALQAAASDDAAPAPPLVPWSPAAAEQPSRPVPSVPVVERELAESGQPAEATRPAPIEATEAKFTPLTTAAPIPSGPADPSRAFDARARIPLPTEPVRRVEPEPIPAMARPAPPPLASDFASLPGLGSIDARIGRPRRARPGAGVFAIAAALALTVGGGAWVVGHHSTPPGAVDQPVARTAEPARPVPVRVARAPAPRAIAPPVPEVVIAPPPTHEVATAPTRAAAIVSSRPPAPVPVARPVRRVALAKAIPAPPRPAPPVALAMRNAPTPAPTHEAASPPLVAPARDTVAPASAPSPAASAVQLATTVQPQRSDNEPAGKRASRRAAIDAIRALQMR